jgi:uncharacterized protein
MTFDHTTAIIAFGGLAGGFVSGLAGFGMALVAFGIWLHVLEPVPAATLTLVCSVAAQLQTIPGIWRDIEPQRVLPFLVPGLAGVPFGIVALHYVDASSFKIGIGVLLVTFASFMLVWRGQPSIAWGGRWADGLVGLTGGILGGLAGLSGAPPSMWATLRGWNKDQKRAVFRTFNLSILGASLVGHAATGHVDRQVLIPSLLALPGTFVGAWLGVTAYKRLSDRNFSDLVMGLLLLSGMTLLASWR